MALSSIDLCSRALLKIGASSIASFDEGTAEAEVAASLYPVVRDAMLSLHPWNFALGRQVLARLLERPASDFSYAFQLPPQCLRVISAGTGGRSRGITYKIAGRRLYCNTEDVILTYIGRPNESDFPAFFDMTLIARLAAEFCIPLTDSTSRWEGLQDLAERELRRARLIDSQEDTAPRFEDFTLIEERR
jgi:hypothetical protein